ncbi:MAG: hypothetical protein E6G20_06380 [Actinobacteria bacterium]|nr:MAG: hypothetical protein E6G20_06380 [Actinomycetota bacterium]
MHVHEPELVRLRDDVRRVRPVLVVLGRFRPDLVLGRCSDVGANDTPSASSVFIVVMPTRSFSID